ncbi:MAG: phosphotransferase [Candidatus Dojkabacteria bacterium]|nr:MAG: phosphotransferase [Candidatus Dojkabacteria bacterium]
MRIGKTEDLEKEIALQSYLQQHNYPVPHVIDHGIYEGNTFFIEENTGNETLAQSFVKQSGTQTEEQRTLLFELLTKYAEAQSLTVKNENYAQRFLEGAYYDEVAENEARGDLKKKMADAKTKLLHDLASVPYVFSHGDFNPWNIFPKAVIDFEYHLWAPFGYDLITCVLHDYNFPSESTLEIRRSNEFPEDFRSKVINYVFEFSKNQLNTSIDNIVESIYLPKLTFSSAHMDRMPKIQQWRFNLLEACIDKYLEGTSYMKRLVNGG